MTNRLAAQETSVGLTFQDALEQCFASVSRGEIAEAANLFEQLELTFGREDEYLDESVQQSILPIRGLVQLGAGKYYAAIESLETYQQQFPKLFNKNKTLIYSLAQCHKRVNQYGKARELLLLYKQNFAGTTEAALAWLEYADLLLLENNIDQALETLAEFYNSDAAHSLKTQGQLKAIQSCLDSGRMDTALQLMLSTRWEVDSMPELAQLTFASLRSADYAMSNKQYSDALKIYRLVPPRKTLISLQQERIDQLSLSINQQKRTLTISTSHQQQYRQKTLRRLESQLLALKNSEDYTPGFYLHYGQCLLFDSQFYKAWLVFEYLTISPETEYSLRQEAHYRWILCAHQLQDWEEALSLARNFVDRYPQSKLAPQVLYMIAKAHLEQRRYAESVEVLDSLIESFPSHALFARWKFTRGFAKVVLEEYQDARSTFEELVAQFPKNRLGTNAQLWHALTHFFEKDYKTALAELHSLKEKTPVNHPTYPEIQYRIAATQYADRNYESSLSTINSYLEKFSRHTRIEEARVLKGDILMGTGELEEAAITFQSITPEAGSLYLYALFQVGKIYKALQEYSPMIVHFEAFVKDEDAPRVRLGEALYWIGWCHLQLEEKEKAQTAFEEALEQYGNDLEFSDTDNILSALRSLNRRDKTGFADWLNAQSKKAFSAKNFTYHVRLELYQLDNSKLTEEKRSKTLSSINSRISIEHFDAQALGILGLNQLAQDRLSAQVLFDRLLEQFPSSPARSMAYLGLARIHFDKGETIQALKWLIKSGKEVPFHAHFTETQLLLGKTQEQLGHYEEAIDVYEGLLKLKSARGRPHALALTGIAEAYETMAEPEKATAYYQRIYNMYRAYADLVSNAYWKSALLFESMERIPDAVHTLEEMLNEETLATYGEWLLAEAKLEELLPLMPEEAEMLEEEVAANNE